MPRPFAAKRGIPDWLKRMAATAPCADLNGDIRTVKQCPPFVDAMGFGFIVPLVTDIRVDRGSFEWDWQLGPSSLGGYTRSPLTFHLGEQLAGAPIADPENAAIKFTNYWTIETPPGYALLVTHPFNREELPFRTLTGLVDADRYKDGCLTVRISPSKSAHGAVAAMRLSQSGRPRFAAKGRGRMSVSSGGQRNCTFMDSTRVRHVQW